MNQQDQQAIDELFRHLYQAAEQAGPRDEAAEALIQRYVKQAPPGLLYQMAQTLVAQQHTVNELRSRLASAQRQYGAPAGFAPPPGAAYQGYGQQGYGQPGGYYQQPVRQGGGFLAGAGQLALGIGGGILGAEVLTSIFDGGLFDGGLFGDGREREFEQGYQDGFAAGDSYGDRDNDPGQDPGYDNAGYDNGGGFDDNAGFDDGGGGFDDSGFGDGIF
jgi:uncharacterized protein